MKLLSLAIALALSGSTLQAASNQAFRDETLPLEVDSEVISPDLYVIHAIHLANLSANRVVIGSYIAPASQEIREQGFAILGRSARIDILLSFLAKPFGVDLAVDLLPDQLSSQKDLIDKAIEALNSSDESSVEQAYTDALEAVKDLESHIIDYSEKNAVSEKVKTFVDANLR